LGGEDAGEAGGERGWHVLSPHRMKVLLRDEEAAEKQAAECTKWVRREQEKDAERG